MSQIETLRCQFANAGVARETWTSRPGEAAKNAVVIREDAGLHVMRAFGGNKMASWHYVMGQERLGPVSDEELRELIRSGTVTRDTLVWKQGFDGWKAAGDVLGAAIDETPPPIPTPPPVPSAVRLSKDEPVASSLPVERPSTPGDLSGQGFQLAGPWPRFWARAIDVWLLGPLLAFLIALAAAFYSPATYVKIMATNATLWGLLLMPLVAILLAFLMATIGTTPGKAILGVRVNAVVDGNRLIFFLIREVKVWVYGLGLGIPFVALFTQIYQCRRVAVGKPAGYDEGFAMVEGAPSTFRVTLGALFAIILLVVLTALNGIDQSAQRDIETTQSWKNPVTNRFAEIARTWTASELKTNSGRAFYFTSPTLVAEAVFGYEQIGFDGVDVKQYANAIKGAISANVQLTTEWSPTIVNGQQALRATGTALKQADTNVEVIVALKGRDAWRALIFSVGRQPEALPGRDRLLNALFRTAY
ncbi:RDD family protein [Pararhizobium sp. BT-229]|uniref:RDD family protein n=1 Tax=Pararhizobium sp. BT-229 TaxID=2986923 RepID=UPI0021F7151D|nr:RDD family protein [Pararhizobium sp. BT-229]MCV9965103.1 RDD family protein [Pararhizobium sp. BT-229]